MREGESEFGIESKSDSESNSKLQVPICSSKLECHVIIMPPAGACMQ